MLLLMTIGCKQRIDLKLGFANKTKKEIFIEVSLDNQFTDSLLNNSKSNLLEEPYSSRYIKPDNTEYFPALCSWESFIDNSKNKRVCFYVFDSDEFRRFRLGELTNGNLKYKFLSYTKEELMKMNWEIEYKEVMPNQQLKTKVVDLKSTTPPPWVNKKK